MWEDPDHYGQMYYSFIQGEGGGVVLQQLLTRDDAQIGVLESIAVWLFLGSFGSELAGHLCGSTIRDASAR